MALSNKRITVMSDTVIGNEKVATHVAAITISGSEKKLTLTSNYLDKDKYTANKATIDADQAEFETYAEGLYTSSIIYT